MQTSSIRFAGTHRVIGLGTANQENRVLQEARTQHRLKERVMLISAALPSLGMKWHYRGFEGDHNGNTYRYTIESGPDVFVSLTGRVIERNGELGEEVTVNSPNKEMEKTLDGILSDSYSTLIGLVNQGNILAGSKKARAEYDYHGPLNLLD